MLQGCSNLFRTGNPLFKLVFKPLDLKLFMENLIVDEELFLNSFGQRQHDFAKKYLFACKLSQDINNHSEIARKINHNAKTVSAWLRGVQTPIAIKSLNFLKSINLMPLKKSNSQEFILFTEITAFLFGDGHLTKNLGNFILFGQKLDLEKISAKINKTYCIQGKLKHAPSNSEIVRIVNEKMTKKSVVGVCWSLSVNNSPVSRLLNLAGAPLGDKVSALTRVPTWIMSGDKELKRIFLKVIFGNELQCPCLRAKNAFSSSQLGLHKIESKEQDLRIFLEQVRKILKEFNISTSQINVENTKTVRKDGNLSKKLYFSIDSHSPNILRLFKEIPFSYAEEKQKKFSNEVKIFLRYSAYLEKDWKLYEQAIKMHDEGFGRRTIFKKLQLPKRYFYKINSWIHYGNKPLYYDEKNVIEDLKSI